jgi:hypothetical protein
LPVSLRALACISAIDAGRDVPPALLIEAGRELVVSSVKFAALVQPFRNLRMSSPQAFPFGDSCTPHGMPLNCDTATAAP